MKKIFFAATLLVMACNKKDKVNELSVNNIFGRWQYVETFGEQMTGSGFKKILNGPVLTIKKDSSYTLSGSSSYSDHYTQMLSENGKFSTGLTYIQNSPTILLASVTGSGQVYFYQNIRIYKDTLEFTPVSKDVVFFRFVRRNK